MKINLSLLTLGSVIHSLSSNSKHVPYSESKLTKILQNSLGGNFKTTLIVACSPHLFNVDETVSSLLFAQRAKTIKNKVKINIKRSNEEMEKLIESLQEELKLLRSEYRVKKLTIPLTNMSNTNNTSNTNNKSNTVKEEKLNMSSTSSRLTLSKINSMKNIGDSLNYNVIIKSKDDQIEKLKEEVENQKEEILQLKVILNHSYNFNIF